MLKAVMDQEGDQISAPVGNETPFSSGHQECWLTAWATWYSAFHHSKCAGDTN